MLDVGEDDFDCSIELAFLKEPAAETAPQDGEAPPAKRTRRATAAQAAQADGAAETAASSTTIVCRASSVMLKLHSEAFRRWIKGWSDGQRKVLHIECDDRQEAEAFQQLLAFLHSAGRVLPDDAHAEPLATQQLLAVARKHGVETCVDACLQLLLAQVDQLPLPACLRLMLLLESGTSGHADVQAQADQLVQRTCERLQTLVKEEWAVVLADAALQEDFAAVLGRWHSMLNCRMRRGLWRALPFELLSLMFEDRHVQADTEATVLAAFAIWADANITAEPLAPLAPEQRERVAAVCSRIRFPEVPPDVLLNYWTCFKWLQEYDKTKELLLRALATAADAQQRALWQSSLSDPPRDGDQRDAADAQAVAADCRLWWTPRVPPLVANTKEATFQLQVDRPPVTAVSAPSNGVFWRGYWWWGDIRKKSGDVAVYIRAACSVNLAACMGAPSNRRAYRVKVAYNQTLHLNGAEASLDSTSAFSPANIFGWGNEDVKDSGGAPIPWERFWAADSPFLRDGCARLELQLSVPPS